MTQLPVSPPLPGAGPSPDARRAALPYLALLGSVLSMGMSAIWVRWANAPGPVSGFYRMLIAVAIFALPFGLEVRRRPKPSARHVWLAVLGGLFFAGDLGTWNTAVLMTSAANATFLGNTAPLWVSLGALWIFKQKLRREFWIGLAVAMGGAAVLLGGDFMSDSTVGWGSVLSIVAGFFYGAFFLAAQRAREGLSAFTTWWISALASTVCLLLVSLLLGNPMTGYPAFTYWSLFGLALTTQIGGYLLVNFALGHLPAPIVSTILLGQPVMTAIFGFIFLQEGLGSVQVIGSLLVLIGIWIVSRYGQ